MPERCDSLINAVVADPQCCRRAGHRGMHKVEGGGIKWTYHGSRQRAELDRRFAEKLSKEVGE